MAKKVQHNGWTMMLVALAFLVLAIIFQFGSRFIEKMTTKTLDGFTGMAFFLMNGCPHCEELKKEPDGPLPTLEADNNYKSKIMVIEKSDDKDVYEKYANGIDGFPTMIIFKDGKMQGKYEGERDVASIKQKIDSI
jgi:hypothetical protein